MSVINWDSLVEAFAWDAARTTLGGQALASRLGLYTREFRRSANTGVRDVVMYLPTDWRPRAVRQIIGLEELHPGHGQERLPFAD